MVQADRWLLPDGMEEILPPEAYVIEHLRRKLLDLFQRWGYQLVMPPLVEYLESLLTGVGHDLDLQTFKVTDQLTGRLMGIRADITPQVSRIDAHSYAQTGPARFCYDGTVLHTRALSLRANRSPRLVGAELYGHDHILADIEIISLMLETLYQSGIDNIYLDVGHVGIFNALSKQLNLAPEQSQELFGLLQAKALPDIEAFTDGLAITESLKLCIKALPALQGGVEVMTEAQALFADYPDIMTALEQIRQVLEGIIRRYPRVNPYIDLAGLRGYGYHTGLLFAAYVEGHGEAIAKGGRYDETGAVFGRARPATGFSADLKALVQQGQLNLNRPQAIFAPYTEDPDMWQFIESLRQQGEIVIEGLPNQTQTAQDLGCSAQLVFESGHWCVQPLVAAS